MGFTTGLDALRELSEKASQARVEFKKATCLKLKDGETKTIRFLQEFDPSHDGYSEKNGLMAVISEHTAPGNFPQPKAECTMESEDRCWACEQNRANPKEGWNIKRRWYSNVLVETDEGPEVQIMSQGIGNKGIFPTVLDIAQDFNGVTHRPFKLKRNGIDQNTGYSLREGPAPKEPYTDLEDYELYDLHKACTRQIPYEEQAAFYSGNAASTANESAPSDTGKSGGWPSEGGPGLSGW